MSQLKNENIKFSTFRRVIIRKMLDLQPKMTGINRREQFIAITIFDKVYIKILSQQALSFTQSPSCSTFGNQNMIIPYAITCIKLASKFESQYNPKIATLAKYFKYEGDQNELMGLCLQAQLQILQHIDYQIPSQTFYSTLQCINWQKSLTSKQICFFLKLFQVGLEFSTELTQNIKYGFKIFENIRMQTKKDEKVNAYVENIKKWAKCQANKQNVVL